MRSLFSTVLAALMLSLPAAAQEPTAPTSPSRNSGAVAGTATGDPAMGFLKFELPLYELGRAAPVRVFENNGDYFFVPAILPDWIGYAQRVTQACPIEEAEHDADADETGLSAVSPQVGIPLALTLDDDEVREEIIARINASIEAGDGTINPSRLHVMPFDMVQIGLLQDGFSIPIASYPPGRVREILESGEEEISVVHHAGVPKVIDAILELPCEDHHGVIDAVDRGASSEDRVVLVGRLFQTGAKYDVTTIRTDLARRISAATVRRLFANEDATIVGDVSSGFSLNIPGVGNIGGGAETSLTAKRLVTRDLLDEARIAAETVYGRSCIGRCQNLVAETLKMAPVSMEATQLFAKIAGDQVEVGNDQIGYITLTDSKIKTDLKNHLRTEQQGSVGGEAASGKEISDQKTEGVADVTMPIPVRGQVSILGEADFIERGEDALLIAERGTDTQYIYPLVYPGDLFLGFRDRKEEPNVNYGRCIAAEQRIPVTTNQRRERSARQNSPKHRMRLEYFAPDGHVITDQNLRHSGDNSRVVSTTVRIDETDPLFRTGDEQWVSLADAKGVRYDGLRAVFSCSRGNNPMKKRRCSVTGQIVPFIEPTSCRDARYAVRGVEE